MVLEDWWSYNVYWIYVWWFVTSVVGVHQNLEIPSQLNTKIQFAHVDEEAPERGLVYSTSICLALIR